MNPFQANRFWKSAISASHDFEELAAHLWDFQLAHNPVMAEYAQKLKLKTFQSLPISYFKHFKMQCGADWEPSAVFSSSGTTGQIPSQHFIRSLDIYEQSVIEGFFHFFKKQSYTILALLPAYLERQNSSLVYMVKTWMERFGLPGSGFYLYNFSELKEALENAIQAEQPILLIGVAFALVDFAEQFPISLPTNSIVIETGGMKGRKKELIRSELHEILKNGFGLDHIYSEYGMTELLSQAYLLKNGRFHAPPWMHVWISDPHLYRLKQPPGQSGRLHVIDLANIHSCAFIATDDIGRQYEDGSFEVLGRLDAAELRGCSLMYV